ncbi:MAG: S-layer homology domain-containing protein [Lawsonibacter sp.]|nr:S-layer homology domain-containing protein [Lawsonibacter sp.]
MTRGMLAQVLYNLEGRPEPAGLGGFSDVETGSWYARSSAWAAETGALSGLGDGRFGPEEPVTRQELSLVLWRYAGSPRDGGNAAQSGEEAQALRWAAEHRVLQGRGSGLEPEGRATRAEAAQMLKNFLERVRS